MATQTSVCSPKRTFFHLSENKRLISSSVITLEKPIDTSSKFTALSRSTGKTRPGRRLHMEIYFGMARRQGNDQYWLSNRYFRASTAFVLKYQYHQLLFWVTQGVLILNFYAFKRILSPLHV